jgi:hypothetical protein
MDTHLPIITKQVFTAKTVGAGTSETSPAINLVNAQSNGFFAIQLTMTGDGTLGLVYEVSIDGVNFVQPTGFTAITTAFSRTSGTGGDGKDIIAFNPELCIAIRLKATATTSDVVLTATLCVQ